MGGGCDRVARACLADRVIFGAHGCHTEKNT